MIEFIEFKEAHLVSLRKWLREPHVSEFWQETNDDIQLKTKFLIDLPQMNVWPFVVNFHGNIIGYIQYYRAHNMGNGWWENETSGTYGLDLMIGDPLRTGQGLGPMIIQKFIQFVLTKQTDVVSFIIDPEPKNTRAIRAYERVGFKAESEITTPGGKALLMRLQIEQIEFSFKN